MFFIFIKLGKDHGKPYRESLIEDGINVDHVKIEDNVITGVASIFVGEEDGQLTETVFQFQI